MSETLYIWSMPPDEPGAGLRFRAVYSDKEPVGWRAAPPGARAKFRRAERGVAWAIKRGLCEINARWMIEDAGNYGFGPAC
jgi:hypothetical protein